MIPNPRFDSFHQSPAPVPAPQPTANVRLLRSFVGLHLAWDPVRASGAPKSYRSYQYLHVIYASFGGFPSRVMPV